MDTSHRIGSLLVAAPSLDDPHFRRAVVLIIDEDRSGHLGVVVNRPSPTPVADHLGDWTPYVGDPAVMFTGGPVGEDSGLALASPAGGDEDPLGWRPLDVDDVDLSFGTYRIGMVDLDAPAGVVGGGLGRMRVFAGHSGWAPGQLEAEIAEGAWYVFPSIADDVFSADPLSLWSRVLRRQGGEMALVSTLPDDPTLN